MLVSTVMSEAHPHKSEPIDYIQRTRDQYASLGYPPYEWVHISETPPFTPLQKPLREAKIGFLSSGGIYRQGQIAFHFKDDFSYREISTATPTSELRATHFAYDLTDARQDPNVVFPLDTLRKLANDGVIGELSERAYTFMGGIYSSRKVSTALAPALAERFIADEVDVVLMVPV